MKSSAKNALKDEAIAYHEAGHAIAAWRLLNGRNRVHRVSIVRDDDSLGQINHAPLLRGIQLDVDDSPRAQRKAEDLMLVCLAGPAAQCKYNPRTVRHYHGAGDCEQVYDLLSHLCSSDKEKDLYFRLMETRAEQFVARDFHWRAIEILAWELLKQRTMSGKVLQEFIIRRCFDRLQTVPS